MASVTLTTLMFAWTVKMLGEIGCTSMEGYRSGGPFLESPVTLRAEVIFQNQNNIKNSSVGFNPLTRPLYFANWLL